MMYLNDKIVIEELTPSELHCFHKELWTWLSEHPECGKKDWPGWDKFTIRKSMSANYNDIVEYIQCQSYCFGCMWEYRHPKSRTNCAKGCLFQWSDDTSFGCNSTGSNSPFFRWVNLDPRELTGLNLNLYSEKLRKRSIAALEVANMPIRRDLESSIDNKETL